MSRARSKRFFSVERLDLLTAVSGCFRGQTPSAYCVRGSFESAPFGPAVAAEFQRGFEILPSTGEWLEGIRPGSTGPQSSESFLRTSRIAAATRAEWPTRIGRRTVLAGSGVGRGLSAQVTRRGRRAAG